MARIFEASTWSENGFCRKRPGRVSEALSPYHVFRVTRNKQDFHLKAERDQDFSEPGSARARHKHVRNHEIYFASMPSNPVQRFLSVGRGGGLRSQSRKETRPAVKLLVLRTRNPREPKSGLQRSDFRALSLPFVLDTTSGNKRHSG